MIGFIANFLRPYRRSLAVVVALVTVQAMANLYLPFLNADIINNGVVPADIGYIMRGGGTMLVITLLLGVVSVVAVYFSARTAMSFGRDVRARVFRHVEGFSLHEVNEFGAPSLITRNTNDVQQVQMLVLMSLTMMISAPLTAVGGVIMALRTNVALSGLLLVVIPVMGVVVALMVMKAVPLSRSMQRRIDAVNLVLRENLAGIRVIRAFNRTTAEEARFARANDELTDASLRVARIYALAMPTLMLVFNLSSVAVIWFGGHLVDSGQMQIGDLTAFLAYIMQILFSVMMAVMIMVMVPRASASADRIREVLHTTPAITDPPEPAGHADPAEPASLAVPVAAGEADPAGLVEFREVEFRYEGAQDCVLRGITLTLRPGTTTAVVGSTGSGKTTLVNLIPRLLDATAGSVLVGGTDVRRLQLEDLWSQLGMVPQRSFLFSGTVADNVRFGAPEATDRQVWDALEAAAARDFVMQMPDGLQSRIDQGGANLSGGQRQRLAIARALARQPQIYLFDDSFSALDYATDARVRSALKRRTASATVLIVAQRVSTILDADQIVVMDQGRIVGLGTHTDLLSTCTTYTEIVLSQMTAEEARA
jgi:ATP-binding cassette subfamily B protein